MDLITESGSCTVYIVVVDCNYFWIWLQDIRSLPRISSVCCWILTCTHTFYWYSSVTINIIVAWICFFACWCVKKLLSQSLIFLVCCCSLPSVMQWLHRSFGIKLSHVSGWICCWSEHQWLHW